jgi:membrane protein implicated in regulation of membrane protease activity
MWVFMLHLVAVFVATWSGVTAFYAGNMWLAVPLLAVWVVAFVVTALDNVVIWRKTRRVGEVREGDTQDKGVQNVQGEPPLSDPDVDQG